ncbi:MAG: S8 family serine peptidase [Chloroflexi bacterium]|nr:S8 family serine peptidase [Ardenticatenaceae bacterium]MBL1130175.1 peptidase S8 [Chloroflexota bacterium]NOG36264.1 S8 family serine peptidase [Chloroflexota bacterium]
MQGPINENSASGFAWGGRILVALLAIWIFHVVWGAQTIVWFVVGSGGSDDGWPWVWASLIQVGLTAVPLLPLAWKWPTPRYRAIFQSWLLACLCPLLLAPIRLFLPTQSQSVLLTQLLLTLFVMLFLSLLFRQKLITDNPSPLTAHRSLLNASGTAVFISLPWFAWGALGSPLDTLLSLGLGLAWGGVAALVGGPWLRSLAEDSRGLGWDMLTGGVALGTAVLILASGLSFNGAQLILMTALPALGGVLMGLVAADDRQPRVIGWLAGLCAAFILMFTDTDGIFLNALDGILRYSFQAAVVSLWLAWLVGFLMLLFRQRLAAGGHGRLLSALSLIIIALGVGVYLFAGQIGFHGDRLFVILKEQADVSAAVGMADYDGRRQFVYDTLTNHANVTQADLRQSLDSLGVAYTPYYLVNAIEVRGGLLHRLWLSTRPEVDRIIPSPVLRPTHSDLGLPTQLGAAPAAPQWNLTNIGADRAWAEWGARGQGIIIGQSDSGVQWDHPELMDSYLGSAGNHSGYWLDVWRGTAVPTDTSGHGTHTLGSVLGNSVGVAPDAQWFACANLARNLGNPALYLDCMQFMLAPYPQGGDPFVDGRATQSAHVLNNSWGCPENYEGCDPLSLLTAVQALRAAGIFVVASAGNSGPDCSTVTDPLPLYDEVFSVGAVDVNNNIANFSSVGPVLADGSGRIKPDIVAPGVDVLSAWPGGGYAYSSGTSMAGPHVAGVVALIWSANPDLIGDIEATEEILRASATPYRPTTATTLPVGAEQMDEATAALLSPMLNQAADPTGDTCLAQTDTAVVPNNIVGYGIVNAYEAVRLALER